MNDAIRFSYARSTGRALVLLAALGFTALVGLATLDAAPAGDLRRPLPADANAQRASGNHMPDAPAALPNARGELDPSMRRIEFGVAHHG